MDSPPCPSSARQRKRCLRAERARGAGALNMNFGPRSAFAERVPLTGILGAGPGPSTWAIRSDANLHDYRREKAAEACARMRTDHGRVHGSSTALGAAEARILISEDRREIYRRRPLRRCPIGFREFARLALKRSIALWGRGNLGTTRPSCRPSGTRIGGYLPPARHFGSARAVTTPASSSNRSSPLKTHDEGGVLEETCVIGACYIGQHLPVGSETTHVEQHGVGLTWDVGAENP
jgi:hypothetical protein